MKANNETVHGLRFPKDSTTLDSMRKIAKDKDRTLNWCLVKAVEEYVTKNETTRNTK